MEKYKVLLVWERNWNKFLPLAFGYLKSYAEADKRIARKVSISIAYVDDITSPESVLAGRPDLVGFSCYGDIPRVLKACAALKNLNGALRIVVGGPAITSIKAAELFAGGPVDFAVRGEGEQTFKDLLISLLSGARAPTEVPGLAFRVPGGIMENPPRPPIADLEAVPSPYLKGVFDLSGCSEFFVENSRGCSFPCRYCPEGGTGLRYFGEQRLAEEVRYILKNAPQARIIVPTDSDFFLNRARAKSLMKVFRTMCEGRRVSFMLVSNAYSWDDEILSALACNRFAVSIGVQSTNPCALSFSKRRTDIKKLKENLRRFRRFAPDAPLNIDVMYGLPGDSLADYMTTLDWAISTGAHLEVNRLRVYPTTDFGRNKERFGLVCEDSYPYFIVSNPNFSALDVERARQLDLSTGFVLKFMIVDKFISAAILRLGAAMRGRTRWPFVHVCEGLSAFIRGSPGAARLISDWYQSKDENYARSINLACRTEILNVILSFGGKLLKAAGRKEKLPALASFIKAAKGRLPFREPSPARAKTAEKILRLRREKPFATLLVCWEDSPDQDLLPWDDIIFMSDIFTGEASGRAGSSCLKTPVTPADACLRLRTLAGATGEAYDTIILSGVYGAIPAGRRAGFLRSLRALARKNGLLLIFDSLSGSPLSARAKAAEKPASPLSALKTAGWGGRPAPAKLFTPGHAGEDELHTWIFLAKNL